MIGRLGDGVPPEHRLRGRVTEVTQAAQDAGRHAVAQRIPDDTRVEQPMRGAAVAEPAHDRQEPRARVRICEEGVEHRVGVGHGAAAPDHLTERVLLVERHRELGEQLARRAQDRHAGSR